MLGQAAFEHLVYEATESHVNKCAAYSRLALLAYDIALNLAREKEVIWSQKFRTSTVIYLFLRYPVIAFQVFNVSFSSLTSHCDALYRFTWALSIIPTRVAITASFVLRVYAIMNLKRRGLILACGLGLLGTTSIAFDVWQDIQLSCSTSSNPVSTVVTFILLATFDVFTTVILGFRTFSFIRVENVGSFDNPSSLFGIVLNQGLIYFFVVSAVQLAVIALYFLPQGVYSLVLNNYSLLISSILLSRFLLDLREHHAHPNRTTLSQEDSPVTDIHFGSTSMVERRAPTSTGIVRDFEVAFTSEHTWNEEFEDITPMEYMQSQSSRVNKD